MAESSIFWTTGALGDGTNPYTMAQITAWLRRTFGSGIHIDFANACVPTEAAPNVTIGTGSACIHGYPYENTAAVNVNIPVPAVDTRIDRIVLRAVWATQTVRIFRIAGVEGGGAPAITQTDGVTWDEYICQASITVGGVITVTDERTFLAPFGRILTGRLINGILSADATGRAKMADGFLSADAAGRAKMADGFVNSAKILDGSVVDADLDSDDLTDIKTATSVHSAVLDTIAVGFTDMVGMTLTPTFQQACDVFMFLTMEYTKTGAGGVDFWVRAQANGAPLEEFREYALISEAECTKTIHWYAPNIPAGARNFKTEWRTIATTDIDSQRRTLSLIVIPVT